MSATGTEHDSAHLRAALELAERGRGRVSPNPLVGAVLVRDGEVIGEGHPRRARRAARRARRARRRPRPRRGPRRRDPLRDARALRPRGPPASLHRGDPRGRDRPRRLRVRGPDREGLGPRPRDAPRRRRRGRARERRRGRAGPAAEPALPQARPHRPAARHLQGRDDPGRPGRRPRRRLALDLLGREPRARPPLALGVRRDRGRHRHRARRRPAADRPERGDRRRPPADPRRVRLAGPAAARLRPGRLGRRGAADRRLRARGADRSRATRWSPPAPR